MCGIAGWVGTQHTTAADHLLAMLKPLSKRGPEAQNIWQTTNAILGHTRLSIIDIEKSTQPCANEDGSVVVTYNGEIYNYRSLRQSCIDKGHTLATDGDTETLVHLYEDYQSQYIDKLDGMFAFGLYDTNHQRLLLARDRIGIKPLYYWHNQYTGELVFASDLSAMLANPCLPRKINQQALSQYMHFGYVVHPHTWIEGIFQLEPGHILEWHNGKISISHYYTWEYAPDATLQQPDKAVQTLTEVLSKSVHDHLIADVPLGAFLSGGLDSSVVTGLAQESVLPTGRPIQSFNVRFWQPQYDESERAAAQARDLKTDHTVINAQTIPFNREVMEQLVQALGEPFGDNSFIATYLLCQQARPYIKVVLSGDGGDEVFMGYSGLYRQRIAHRAKIIPRALREIGVALTKSRSTTFVRRINKYLDLSLLDESDIIFAWSRRWEPALLTALHEESAESLMTDRHPAFPDIRAVIGEGERGGFAEQQLRFHMLVDLPCDCLFKVDRMSMAHGLEVRVPLLSNAMLDYAGALPLAMRNNGGRTKEPLRTLAERLTLTNRVPSPKRGFSFPLTDWVKSALLAFWRGWDITSSLVSIGFHRETLTALVEQYEQLPQQQDSYTADVLTRNLFDLLLLGIWVQVFSIVA